MAKAGDVYLDVHGDFGPINRQLRGNQAAFKQSLGQMESSATRSYGKIGTAQEHVNRKQRDFRASVGSTARSIGRYAIASAGIYGTARALGVVVREYDQSVKAGKQTNAVLKSTGAVAHVTGKDVAGLASKIALKTGIDDEAIQSSENLLLTFTDVRNEVGKGNDIFSQATRIITDMSVALGQDLNSSTIQVGKALQDPIKGITALRRVGVNFNAQQTDMVKKLVESGHQLDAQKFILRELNKEFAGSAAAQATPIDRLKQRVNDLAESVGRTFAPQMDGVIKEADSFVKKLDVIFSDPKLSQDQKIGKVASVIQDEIELALPQIANTAGQIAPKVALAFVNGFIRADAWGKLLLGAFLVSKLVGWQHIFRAAGRRGAAAFGERFIPTMAAEGAAGGTAAGVGASRGPFGRSGTAAGVKWGAAFRVAALAGAIAAVAAVDLWLAKKARGTLSGTNRESAATNLSKRGYTNIQFVGTKHITATSPSGKRQKFTVGRQRGGMIPGNGIGDKVPALLEPGEGLINKEAVRGMGGPPAIDRINRTWPRFQQGGVVGRTVKLPPGWEDLDPMIGPGNAQVPGYARGATISRREGPAGPQGPLGPPRQGSGGRYLSTAYGPPWNSLQGFGVTRTGINLKSSPPYYIVAVDPNVIRLHSRLTAQPNPFGYQGTFGAEDTGGAIKGRHIDFYDWRGRAKQNQWGSRNVTVAVVGHGGSVPRPVSTGGGGGGQGGRGSHLVPVSSYLGRANYLDRLHLPYIWGGHHGDRGPIQDPRPGLDCSSAVSYVLGVTPRVSGAFANWGSPGAGPITTFSNAQHVFMNIRGRGFGTSSKNPKGGPGWLPYSTPEEAGGFPGGHFVTRHIGVGTSQSQTIHIPGVGNIRIQGPADIQKVRDAITGRFESKLALAQLTPRLTDDLRAEKNLLTLWRTRLDNAKRSHDDARITEAAGKVKEYRDQITATRDAIRKKRSQPELFKLGDLTKIGKTNIGGIQPTLDRINNDIAQAALTETFDAKGDPLPASFADDVSAAKQLVDTWTGIWQLAQGGRFPTFDPKTKAFTGPLPKIPLPGGTLKQKTEAATNLKSARDALKSVQDEASPATATTATDTGVADLLRKLLDESRHETAIARAILPPMRLFENAPRFHEGGVFKGPTEGPAILRPKEGVFTPEQMAAMGNQPIHVTVIVEDDAVDKNKIRVEAGNAVAEMVRKARNTPAPGRRYAYK